MPNPSTVHKLTTLIPGIVSARHPETTPPPQRATQGAAAWDVYTAHTIYGPGNWAATIDPGQSVRLETGVTLVWDPDYQARVLLCERDPGVLLQATRMYGHSLAIACYGVVSPRSGMRDRGLSILGDGIIDMDYTGEIVVRVWNVSMHAVTLDLTKAVAQLRICAHVAVLPPAAGVRVEGNAGGFGSTDAPKPLQNDGFVCSICRRAYWPRDGRNPWCTDCIPG